MYGKKLHLSTAMLKNKPKEIQLLELQQELKKIDLTFSINQLKGTIEVFISNLSCVYSPKDTEKIEVPIILFETSKLAKKGKWLFWKKTNAKRWQELTNDKVHAYTVSGDHWSILKPPHVNELAKYLLKKLKE